MRVLVVDDMAEMRVLISRVLSSNGYEVDVAASVHEARELFSRRYDVLIVDDHLGSDRGTDLVGSLVAVDPTVAERCVMITGGIASDLPAGVAFLVKPFKPDELIGAVRAVPTEPRARPLTCRAVTGRPTTATMNRQPRGPRHQDSPDQAQVPHLATAMMKLPRWVRGS